MTRHKSARNLADVARELNVSVSLVSKVLNGRLGTSGARPDTVRAILSKAEELGYRKNTAAAALITGRQNAIGVMVHQHGVRGSSIAERTVIGIAEMAAARKQRLMLNFYLTADQFRALMMSVHHNVMDGLLLAGVSHRELLEELQELRRGGVPVVTVHDEVIDDDFPNAGMCQTEVMRVATAHLIERGCRRIVLVNARSNRLTGFELALRDAGMPIDPTLIYAAKDFGVSSGELAVQAMDEAGIAFDGVVGQSDHHAIGAMNVLHRTGRRVPEDVKITGVDDSPSCHLSYVPITSVSQEDGPRGAMAVQMLLDRLEGADVKSVWIAPVLHVRGSSS